MLVRREKDQHSIMLNKGNKVSIPFSGKKGRSAFHYAGKKGTRSAFHYAGKKGIRSAFHYAGMKETR
jgi:hypothetical protein